MGGPSLNDLAVEGTLNTKQTKEWDIKIPQIQTQKRYTASQDNHLQRYISTVYTEYTNHLLIIPVAIRISNTLRE